MHHKGLQLFVVLNAFDGYRRLWTVCSMTCWSVFEFSTGVAAWGIYFNGVDVGLVDCERDWVDIVVPLSLIRLVS